MPKILESVREQLLETARRQIETRGYAGTTVRSVATACGIAIGTVYNYFPSKDMLIASVVAEDWYACLAAMRGETATTLGGKAEACSDEEAEETLRRVYESLAAFAKRYEPLFSDKDAEKSYFSSLHERHAQLRGQLAERILPLCRGEDPDFTARFLAEALLTWTVAGVPFERFYAVARKLL